MSQGSLAIAITGAGGAGVITCGELLLRARARAGGHGLLRKVFGPQIRGGESAALVSFTAAECYTAARRYRVLAALDWMNFDRFEDEIQLDGDSLVLCPEGVDPPAAVVARGVQVRRVDFAGLAQAAHPDGRENMLVTGLLGAMLSLPVDALEALARDRLAGKPEAYRDAAAACIRRGAALGADPLPGLPPPRAQGAWCLSGNQAAAYGAVQAGVRFVAAYPITPASDVLEWLAGALEQVGGHLMQAEDELAAINMAIGASFGGVPAFTATSGPGLALMTESIGLAVASETPLVILDVMRGGPSTGIPTKSEQSDLNIALHGLHGDAPHVVLAPLDVADCAFTTGWAVGLARQLQTAVVVLSDQYLGQSTAVVSPPAAAPAPVVEAAADDNDYLRYRLTESGISTLAAPGDAGHRFTADGLEHDERGTPSARQSHHTSQLDKRRDKLLRFDYGADWGRVEHAGEGGCDLALVGFGSASAALAQAAEQLRAQGLTVRAVALRLLSPLPKAALTAALEDCRAVAVVEQNHGGQLYRYLRGELDLPGTSVSYARPGPAPLDPGEVARTVLEALE